MFAVTMRVAGLAAALVCLLPAAALANGWTDPGEQANNVLFQVDTTDAAAETNEPLTDLSDSICGEAPNQFEIEKTQWFSFRGTGGPMYFTTAGSNFDTAIGLYEGPPAATLDDALFCQNDRAANDADSQLELSSTEEGKEYLLQIGGCDDDLVDSSCPAVGPRSGAALFAAVGNDSRSFPETIQPGPRLSRTNAGASTDPGELTSCGPAPLGKSVWFRYNAPSAGRATFEVTGFDTVIGIYRGGGPRLACNDNAGDANTAEISLNVTPGAYIIQVGGKGVGEAAAFFNFGYRVLFTPADTSGGGGGGTTPVNPDTDGDGLPDSQDCAPTDPKRRAGFPEIRGNKIDENCDQTAQDFLEVRARRGPVTYLATASTLLRSFLVNRLSKGDKVTITCKGKGCRTKRVVKTFRKARAKYDFRRALRRNRPRPGAVIEVRVTHAGRIGHVWRFTFRSYKAPKLKEDLCLRPGASKPKPCR